MAVVERVGRGGRGGGLVKQSWASLSFMDRTIATLYAGPGRFDDLMRSCTAHRESLGRVLHLKCFRISCVGYGTVTLLGLVRYTGTAGPGCLPDVWVRGCLGLTQLHGAKCRQCGT